MTENSNQEKPGTEKDVLEKQRLELEIKEREWNISWWRKASTLAPLFAAIILGLGFLCNWHMDIEQRGRETERLRTDKIANLKREFASDNPSVRIGAALALAEYPKEAIPLLITSLGSADTAFTTAVRTSLNTIGAEAINPLIKELRRLEDEIRVIFAPLIEKIIPGLKGLSLPKAGMTWYVLRDFSLNTLFNEDLEEIRKKLKASIPPKMDKEIDAIITQLKNMRSSKPQLIIAHENTVEVLAELLHHHHISRCGLSGLELSGAFLSGANLSDAVLISTNLSGANLINTNLSNAVLVETNLSGANLTRANLSGADLSYADLPSADFREVNLYGVRGFNDIDDFNNTNLKSVKGLSKKDLEYAKSKGAITD